MKDKTVSIIVPVYNVESYISDCIKSILKQTYLDAEIILVDDGSTDRSGDICEKFAEDNSKIKVIHKENGGLSDARNTGLEAAEGEFIAFIDADDCIDGVMIETLYTACIKYSADISVCNYKRINEEIHFDDLINRDSRGTHFIYTNCEALNKVYSSEGKGISFIACNKLYRKALFTENNIIYPLGKFHEDEYTTYKLFYFSKCIYATDAVLYYYRIRGGSIMRGNYNFKSFNGVEARKGAVEFFYSYEAEELLQKAFYVYCKTSILFWMKTYLEAPKEYKQEFLKQIKTLFVETWTLYHDKVDTSFIKGCCYLLFPKFPFLVSKILKSYTEKGENNVISIFRER